MKKLIILCFLHGSYMAQSQIQFWTKDEIINKQFQQARKEMKISKVYNYVTSEYWTVDDSSRYNEITDYDQEGRKIGYRKYKTDWVKNKRYFMYIDSIFYSGKGVFSELKRYSPQNDGSYYTLSYDAKVIMNAKGQIQRINYYNGNAATELSSYDLYTYDVKNRVIKIVSYTPNGEKDTEWKIDYDNANRVVKVRSASAFGNTDYVMKYTADGLLALYTELYDGKEKQGETTYKYDSNKRLIQADNQTSSDYTDTMQYSYHDNDKLFYHSYLKYPMPEGNGTRIAHEFLVYKFELNE